jgi:hypothetical protein
MSALGIKDLRGKLDGYVERPSGRVSYGEDLTSADSTRRAVMEAVEKGELRWNGGKPKGLRGVVVRGEPMSETVIRARR